MSSKAQGGAKRPLTAKEEAEQEDKRLLAENTAKMDLVMQLLLEGENRDTANRKVETARGRMGKKSDGGVEGEDMGGGKAARTFHPYKGKRVPIRKDTGDWLDLAGALETQLKTREVGKDLLESLHRLAQKRVEILERQIGRG